MRLDTDSCVWRPLAVGRTSPGGRFDASPYGCSMSRPSASSRAASPAPAAAVLLVLLCGLPSSGKSTVARRIAREATGEWDEVHLVSFDAVYDRLQQVRRTHRPTATPADETPAAGTDTSAAVWHASRAIGFQLVADLVRRLASAATPRRHLVLVDDNFFLRSMRRPFFQLARDERAAFLQIHVTCPVDVCCQRNQQRRAQTSAGEGEGATGDAPAAADIDAHLDQLVRAAISNMPIPAAAADTDPIDAGVLASAGSSAESLVTDAIIRKMAAAFEAPPSVTSSSSSSPAAAVDSLEEGRGWERFSCSIDGSTSADGLAIPWRLLSSAFAAAVPAVPLDPAAEADRVAAARATTDASRVHALDLASRQLLNQRLADLRGKTTDQAIVQTTARQWNARRKQLLAEAKCQPASSDADLLRTFDEQLSADVKQQTLACT